MSLPRPQVALRRGFLFRCGRERASILRSCGPPRGAGSITGKALRLAGDSCLGPGENSVWVVERPTIPPAIDWRAFSLLRRTDPVECSVSNRIAVIAEKLADLLPRQTPLDGFD